MMHPVEIVESVGDVWLIWLLSGGTLGLLAAKIFSGRSERVVSWRTLLASEDGATYSLIYVMVFPFFMLLVCLVVETTLILMVKTGTVYAAYAAARSETVWATANPNRHLERRKTAAVGALAPFAASGQIFAIGSGVLGTPSAHASAYFLAYQQITRGSASMNYLTAKYRYAEQATEVEDAPANEGDIAVRITYEMPINVPGVGRILGQRASWPGARFYSRKISSTVVMPDESPQNTAKTLGIGYESE